MIDVSAAILTGGKGSRMGFVDKSRLRINGQTMLERLISSMEGLFQEIMVVSRIPENIPLNGIKNISDIHQARCSLTGIHAALENSVSDHVFISSCDAPFLKRELIQEILSRLKPEDDVLIPIHQGKWFEPLCAVYSKRCLPFIKKSLNNNNFQIINFFSEVVVSKIPTTELQKHDPKLESFINVNTPEDLKAACERAGDSCK
ncbi:molybdenum cofactor guanylyltransferase [Maridesulfovibrio bastinii]|uniref:molybdenum cofactor guanylyltransferase n=1 Tax=Maridesulfovibrio bastinii TaxID=47157 RepID=UPI000423B71D|nr:molybdenum cofactor guanylyltransferase [Maridesulfovibrio bastinii]